MAPHLAATADALSGRAQNQQRRWRRHRQADREQPPVRRIGDDDLVAGVQVEQAARPLLQHVALDAFAAQAKNAALHRLALGLGLGQYPPCLGQQRLLPFARQ